MRKRGGEKHKNTQFRTHTLWLVLKKSNELLLGAKSCYCSGVAEIFTGERLSVRIAEECGSENVTVFMLEAHKRTDFELFTKNQY